MVCGAKRRVVVLTMAEEEEEGSRNPARMRTFGWTGQLVVLGLLFAIRETHMPGEWEYFDVGEDDEHCGQHGEADAR
jgi:hypothetical protein